MLLAKTVSPEARRDPHPALAEVLFHMNFLSFEDKELSPSLQELGISAKEHTSAPNEMETSYLPPIAAISPPITYERGYAYVFPQTVMMAI